MNTLCIVHISTQISTFYCCVAAYLELSQKKNIEGRGHGDHRTQQGQVFTDISVFACSSYHSLEPRDKLELNLTTVFSHSRERSRKIWHKFEVRYLYLNISDQFIIDPW